MRIFEVGHGRVSSRGVLETGRGLWKTEKVGESDGRTGIKGSVQLHTRKTVVESCALD